MNNQNEVIVSSTEEAAVITSVQEFANISMSAWKNFNSNNNQYKTYLKDDQIGNTDLTDEEYNRLAKDAQSNLASVMRINQLSRYFINKDELIGKVYETIESNINTKTRHSFVSLPKETSTEKIEEVRNILKSFDKQINLPKIIKNCIPMTYAEGNYISYLRGNKKDGYIVDYYPLGVAYLSDYEVNGEPVALMDIEKLSNGLKKTIITDKKGKAVFFKLIGDEIKANFPKEVYDAYSSKNKVVKLDVSRTGVSRVNNLNRKYGLTPIFRTFKSAGMLDVYEKADRVNTKAKAKKIIWQKLHLEAMGKEYADPAFDKMAYAHQSFMNAWKNDTVIYTSPAFVEKVQYVEPQVDTNNSADMQTYRSKLMTSLGIGFLNMDSKQTFTVANITITELMKTINKISEQVEDIVQKWYGLVLSEYGYGWEYVPKVKIIDSEMLSNDIKLQLVEILHNKLNLSMRTSLEVLGFDSEEETQRRIEENEKGTDTIFYPRQTAYTSTGENGDGGRPVDNNDLDKQMTDQNRRGSN